MALKRGNSDVKVLQPVLKIINDQEQIFQVNEAPTKISIKRSFDVAFLLSKNTPEMYHQPELSVRSDLIDRNHYINSSDAIEVIKYNNNNNNDTEIYVNSEYTSALKSNEERYSSGSMNSTISDKSEPEVLESELPRSAFSKVTQINIVESPAPPPLSPDQLSCSSASPPISYSPPSANFRPEYAHFSNSSAFQAINHGFSSQSKYSRFLYRGNLTSTNNQNIHNSTLDGHLQAFKFGTHAAACTLMTQPEQFSRIPAAAILSSLLPTTLGALSLPAQNVCAKCNISFRMTSDLVFHMRSQHTAKNVQDPNRRKREEKLKCKFNVCKLLEQTILEPYKFPMFKNFE